MNSPEANLDESRFGVYGSDEVGNTTITYTRLLNHPVDKVWRAITIPEHRKTWFPELSLEHAPGGEAVVNFSGSDCPAPEDNPSDVYFCKVIRFEPPYVLEYQGPNEHHLYELEKVEEGCRLTFMAMLPAETAFDDEAQTIQAKYSVACGWHYKLDEMEWDLAGIPFEDEGYAGPIKTKYYFEYLKRDKNK